MKRSRKRKKRLSFPCTCGHMKKEHSNGSGCDPCFVKAARKAGPFGNPSWCAGYNRMDNLEFLIWRKKQSKKG